MSKKKNKPTSSPMPAEPTAESAKPATEESPERTPAQTAGKTVSEEKTEPSVEAAPGETAETAENEVPAEATEVSEDETPAGDADAQPPNKLSSLSTQQQMKRDPLYRRGHRIYLVGLIVTAVFLLGNTVRYFMEIELILNGQIGTPYLNFLVVIPAAIMITGVAMTEKACRQYDVKEENKMLIVFISVCTVLIVALGIVNLVKPPKWVYTSTNYELRPGQTLTAMEYVGYGLLDEPRPKMPPDHRVDVYKTWGPFGQLVASDDVFFGSYEILTAEGENAYYIHVVSMSKDELYPFTY